MILSNKGRTLIKVTPDEIPQSGHFNVPSTVNKIQASAFLGCKNLTHLTFPEHLTAIEGCAFLGCTSLTEVTFPEYLTDIGSEAFLGCTGLTEITFPERLTHIGSEIFKYCKSLQLIAINTQNEFKFKRTKALLPDDLQDKVIDRLYYEALILKAKTLRQDALDNLSFVPQINPLTSAIPFFRTTDKSALPMINQNDILFNINQFVGRDSKVYAAAEDEMKALPIPLDKSRFDAYKKQLASIVERHKANAKNAVSAEPEETSPPTPSCCSIS